MENISQMLTEALAPYSVSLVPSDRRDHVLLAVTDSLGSTVLAREFHLIQLADTRSLTDVVDGLHRDLLIAEGRLEPSVIAALRGASAASAMLAGLR
ncbi:DUF3509 domain-containing protein [Pseudomonas typographi]|uniref:DUF3509 domain-containing protein n=1 Tax=Pseudomonas typographi TaxID=2715964 RepID=A0ABR7Z7Q6_9PSED|nr:DUF3509 domain-containing protein [Pseudomonas typographi]MBD1553668.1 DUF3509 domain-containing protein [Pseudomonas typographi]MBD1589028.1 DUF3509 domain-containing protein [Pseudomonas typographi]MBD1601457.1 DUF3509 domain-containing protein [Pseudomonas typographi]